MDDTGSGLPTPARHGQNERAMAVLRGVLFFAAAAFLACRLGVLDFLDFLDFLAIESSS
jgi:hypothetical protein